MREVELKSVVSDTPAARQRLEQAGGVLTFEGRLVDLRYGDDAGRLLDADHVLRLRTYERDGVREGHIDWKGPTAYAGGYKVREEVSTPVGDPDAAGRILENLGYRVIRAIERDIAQYTFEDAVVRFEKYPRMDELVEVEGPPEAIERAIAALGLPREGFNTDRLPDFVARYEARTGERAALTDREKSEERAALTDREKS
jgi:predicted adenylyl cyclase CyaB